MTTTTQKHDKSKRTSRSEAAKQAAETRRLRAVTVPGLTLSPQPQAEEATGDESDKADES